MALDALARGGVDDRQVGQIAPHAGDELGDTICCVAPGTPRERVLVHDAAVRAAVTASVGRIRLLVTIAGAAGKIATMIATPGAAVMALPVAYKCVRDMYEQWTRGRPVKGPRG